MSWDRSPSSLHVAGLIAVMSPVSGGQFGFVGLLAMQNLQVGFDRVGDKFPFGPRCYHFRATVGCEPLRQAWTAPSKTTVSTTTAGVASKAPKRTPRPSSAYGISIFPWFPHPNRPSCTRALVDRSQSAMSRGCRHVVRSLEVSI